jgi:hypothetical protein
MGGREWRRCGCCFKRHSYPSGRPEVRREATGSTRITGYGGPPQEMSLSDDTGPYCSRQWPTDFKNQGLKSRAAAEVHRAACEPQGTRRYTGLIREVPRCAGHLCRVQSSTGTEKTTSPSRLQSQGMPVATVELQHEPRRVSPGEPVRPP